MNQAPAQDHELPEVERLVREAAEAAAATPPPLATYRVQLHGGFRFEDARKIVSYLVRLGISDLYTSPYLKASPGSTHGYDVVDHRSIHPEIGTEVEHAALCAALAEAGLGQLLDVVPNHMGIERENALWRDVLENGPSSLYAHYFDIDFDPVKQELKNKVLLPILGDQYGVVLERGELQLSYEAGAFSVRYYQHDLPISPRQYRHILGPRMRELERELGSDHLDYVELQSILTAMRHLPRRTSTERARMVERNREKEVIKRRLAAVVERNPKVRDVIARSVAALNGTPEDPKSFDALDRILSVCSYRLAHWRVAGEEINYRRFFDVNALAAIRVEDPEVFEAAHVRIFEWLAEGKLSGLRIDHPDGLFDPAGYFLALQERYFLDQSRKRLEQRGQVERFASLAPALRQRFRAEAMENPQSPLRRGLYVVLEKIQGGRERMPEAWCVHGTTGYRFANAVAGLFVDRAHEQVMTEIYQRFIGAPLDYRELVYEKKKLVMSSSMASEINVLARELNRISEMNRRTRDFTLGSLRWALVEFIALFPVYRTYIDAWRPEVEARDVQYIQWTLERAKEKDVTTNPSIYDFLGDVLLGRLNPSERAVTLRFAMKLQQVTGPVMAKGVEDTVFYVYNRLVSLNEVGGEPERFGLTVEAFHLRNQERAHAWPAALLATSTHDTKRSEDVRARLNVLSEIPQEWEAHVHTWAALNAPHRTVLKGGLAPDPNAEYLFYQTVVGALPMGEDLPGEALASFRARLRDYMLKAIREAKVHTSWVNPSQPYEEAVVRFTDAALDPERSRAFLDDVWRFKRRIERAGQVNSLAQVLLKIASPGTTDVYQGCELWDLSLVDPDNRRPVDFARRAELLEELDRLAEADREGLCRALWDELDDGRAKLFVLSQGLRLRRHLASVFRSGDYQPLDVLGDRSAHAIAFARTDGQRWVVAVAPRLVLRLLEPEGRTGWRLDSAPRVEAQPSPSKPPLALTGTEIVLPQALGDAELQDAFTGRRFRAQGGTLELGHVLSVLPVALLFSEERR